jgi:hypothetical protein
MRIFLKNSKTYMQCFGVKCMHSYLVWKYWSQPFSWFPMNSFCCELVHVLEIIWLSQDLFIVLPFLPIIFLGRSLQLLFLVRPFLIPLSMCFDTASYNALCWCFNCLFYFKGFSVLFQHKKFSRRKSLKDLVLFMRTENFNVCIKTVL